MAFQNCDSLKNIKVNWQKPIAISSNVFRGIDVKTISLKVPNGSASAYRTAKVWQDFMM